MKTKIISFHPLFYTRTKSIECLGSQDSSHASVGFSFWTRNSIKLYLGFQALSRENLWFQLSHYEYLVLTISNSYSEEEENPLSTTLKTTLCKFISDMWCASWMLDSTCPSPSRVNIHRCCFVIIYFIYKMLLKKVAVINQTLIQEQPSNRSTLTPEHVDKIAAFSRNVTRSLLKYLCCASSTLLKIILDCTWIFRMKTSEKAFPYLKTYNVYGRIRQGTGETSTWPLACLWADFVYIFGVASQICINIIEIIESQQAISRFLHFKL